MTLTYDEQEFVIVATNQDGKQFFIPKDESNSDYQAYLNKDNPDWNKPMGAN